MGDMNLNNTMRDMYNTMNNYVGNNVIDNQNSNIVTSTLRYIQLLSLKTESINNNGIININTINAGSQGFSLDERGVVTIENSGVYLFYWWFNTNGKDVVISLVNEENMEVLSSSNAPTSNRIGIKGNAILNMQNNSRVALVNDSGTAQTIITTRGAVSGSLTIYRIS